MGEFRKIPPNDDFRHTVEIKADGGTTEVFLDGIEVRGLTGIDIQANAKMAYPEVTMTFAAGSVTVDGMMATKPIESEPPVAKHSEWRPFPGPGMGVASPPPKRTAASHSIPWSEPTADPLGDLTRAKEAMERIAGIPYDRAVLPDGTVLTPCPTCTGRGCESCSDTGWVPA